MESRCDGNSFQREYVPLWVFRLLWSLLESVRNWKQVVSSCLLSYPFQGVASFWSRVRKRLHNWHKASTYQSRYLHSRYPWYAQEYSLHSALLLLRTFSVKLMDFLSDYMGKPYELQILNFIRVLPSQFPFSFYLYVLMCISHNFIFLQSSSDAEDMNGYFLSSILLLFLRHNMIYS